MHHQTRSASIIAIKMSKLLSAAVVPSTSPVIATHKHELFIKLFEQELVREFSYLADCVAGRAEARDSFFKKMVSMLNTGIDSIPLIGSFIGKAFDAVNEVNNYLRDRQVERTVNMVAGIDLNYLEILAHLV